MKSKIVFVTAHDRFAVEAFRENAFDYLLKPVRQVDLNNLFERIKNEFEQVSLKDKINNLITAFEEKRIHFYTRTGFVMINPLDIVFVKASGNYSEIYCNPPPINW